MAIPSTWTIAWARSRGAGADKRGNVFDVTYRAPAGVTLADARTALAYGSYYPGESGLWGARLNVVSVKPDENTKQVLVSYHYEPSTLEDVLIDNVGDPEAEPPVAGHVLVEARSMDFSYRPVADVNGKFVWHQQRDADDGPSYKWEPIAGSGIRLDRRIQFRTRFAKTYGMGGNLLGYQDTVNDAIYTQYWSCPMGTLRFAAWHKTRAPTTDKLWLYDCLIEYHPQGWNTETKVQKFQYKAYEIERLQEDGEPFDPKQYDKTVGDWFPVDAPYPAEMYKPAQWPLILGLYDW